MNDYDSILRNFQDFIQHYMDQAQMLVREPRHFFRMQRESKDYWEPMMFAGVNVLLPKLIFALMIAPFTFLLSLVCLIPLVIYAACLLVLVTVILHGLVRVVGSTASFNATFRCVAYASIAYYTWLIPIPFFNLLLFTGYFCSLLYIAFLEVHRLDSQKAISIVVLPGLIIMVLGTLATLLTLWVMLRGVLFLLNLPAIM